MSDLGETADAQPTDDFATIPDVAIQSSTDIVNPNQIRSGVTRGIQQLGSDKVYSDGGNNQIIVADDMSPRVLMGNQATFGEGFYVSQSGIDATTNTDPSQWIFNSNQDIFKIVQTGITSTPVVSATNFTTNTSEGDAINTIPHGLSFTPVVISVIQDPSGVSYQPMPYSDPEAGGTGGGIQVATYYTTADNTNIYIRARVVAFGGYYGTNPNFTLNSRIVKYFLLQETVS